MEVKYPVYVLQINNNNGVPIDMSDMPVEDADHVCESLKNFFVKSAEEPINKKDEQGRDIMRNEEIEYDAETEIVEGYSWVGIYGRKTPVELDGQKTLNAPEDSIAKRQVPYYFLMMPSNMGSDGMLTHCLLFFGRTSGRDTLLRDIRNEYERYIDKKAIFKGFSVDVQKYYTNDVEDILGQYDYTKEIQYKKSITDDEKVESESGDVTVETSIKGDSSALNKITDKIWRGSTKNLDIISSVEKEGTEVKLKSSNGATRTLDMGEGEMAMEILADVETIDGKEIPKVSNMSMALRKQLNGQLFNTITTPDISEIKFPLE